MEERGKGRSRSESKCAKKGHCGPSRDPERSSPLCAFSAPSLERRAGSESGALPLCPSPLSCSASRAPPFSPPLHFLAVACHFVLAPPSRPAPPPLPSCSAPPSPPALFLFRLWNAERQCQKRRQRKKPENERRALSTGSQRRNAGRQQQVGGSENEQKCNEKKGPRAWGGDKKSRE